MRRPGRSAWVLAAALIVAAVEAGAEALSPDAGVGRSVHDAAACDPRLPLPLTQEVLVTVLVEGDEAAVRPASLLDTIRDVQRALRGCLRPPPRFEGRTGTSVSLRFALRRDGALVGPPRLSYVTPGVAPDLKERYRAAAMASLTACLPLPLTPSLGAALAGKPFAARLIDRRT